MLLLSETRTTADIEDIEISFVGYTTIRCDSHNRRTGGVIILVKNNISFQIIGSYVFGSNCWILSIKVNTEPLIGTYSVIYHSPSASDAEFLDYFENWVEEYMSNNHIIVGDFNINMHMQTTYSNRLQRIINSAGMKQLVNKYTRETLLSRTIIDLVITNFLNIKVEVKDTPNITDHNLIEIILPSKIKNTINTYNIVKCYNKYDKTTFHEKLSKINWNSVVQLPLIHKAKFFSDSLENVIDDITPIKKCRVSSNKWFNGNVAHTQDNRNKAYKRAKLTNQKHDWDNYKILRNQHTHMMRQEKTNFIQKRIESTKTNQKLMWQELKAIVGNKKSPQNVSSEIIFEQQSFTDPNDIAENFNRYFINSIEQIHNSIPHATAFIPQSKILNLQFKFHKINSENLLNIMKTIKKKQSLDGINITTLLDGFTYIGGMLLDIINESLESGEFPENWKYSTVVPVPKVNNTMTCEEFRPINMLPTYEKILECVVKQQLEDYIESNNILTDIQSGFRKNHSCETALNLVINDWKSDIDDNKHIIAVFLDLKRAFETIDREILLNKLELYGIKSTENKWFRSYLTGRKQRTQFKNKTSTLLENNLGIPQGSVLGPLIFILYINDIIDNIKIGKLNLFADDTLLSVSSNKIEDLKILINNEIKSLEIWFNRNKLKLNASKTKYMIISNRKLLENIDINISDEKIQRVQSIKYLGVIIDQNLNFKEHIDFIIKKVGKKIGFFNRISSKLTAYSKIIIYKTIITPHFDYCSSVLFLANANDLGKLQKLQNKAMRTVLKCNRLTPIKLMLECLQWQSIKQRVYYNTLILIYKLLNGLLPNYLCENVTRNKNVHLYNTRRKSEIRLELHSKSCTQNSLFYKGFKLFNELPAEIKNCRTVVSYKREVNKFVKNRYS